MLYHTYSILTSEHLMATSSKKQLSTLGCYFGETYPFFEIVILFYFRNPLLPTCAYRPWDHFRFLVKTQVMVKHESNLGFLLFVSFSISLIFGKLRG